MSWFVYAITILGTIITTKVVEPKLGKYEGGLNNDSLDSFDDDDDDDDDKEETDDIEEELLGLMNDDEEDDEEDSYDDEDIN